MAFQIQRFHAFYFVEQKYNFSLKRNEIENGKFHSHFQKDEPSASAHIKSAN